MPDLTRRALPIDWRETTCPECGAELKFGEFIFSCRSLEGWDEDDTLIIGQDYEDSSESSDDEHLYCTGCAAEWELPENHGF